MNSQEHGKPPIVWIAVTVVLALAAVGLGMVKLIALPFGWIGTASAAFFGFLLVVIAIGVLVLFGRRRQARTRAARAA